MLVASFVATIITIIGVLYQLISKKRKWTECLTIFLLLFFITTTAFLYVKIDRYNETKVQAAELIKKWPKRDKIDFTSMGELRGIVLSGLSFLEKNKEYYPDTYNKMKNLFENEFGVVFKEKDDDWSIERNKLEEATLTIMQYISDISFESE